jgi:type IV pilus assembly protein PilF
MNKPSWQVLSWQALSCMILSVMLLGGCATTNTNNSGNSDIYNETAVTARARAHTDLGAAYLQQGKYEIALSEFNEATQIDANYALAYSGLGLVYAALGEDAKADANYKKSIELQPRSSESHNNYGSFLCSRKRYDESIKHFLEAVKNPLYGTPHLAYANAGICSARKNDIKNAEVYLIKALQLEPLTHSAATQLADIQFKRGDATTAQKTLQNALVASPSAETLWLGIKIARALGDKDGVSSYALQLRQQYPSSEETRLLLSGK